MEKIVLENEELYVEINSFGAELSRIKNKKNDKEYLWNADEKYWKRHSPVLFPFVGSLKDKKYKYDGKEYFMRQHGFARDMEFQLLTSKSDEIWFVLNASDETIAKYPFIFSLEIGYKLEKNNIKVMWKVKNNDTKEMYFSIGAHPAFYCPINDGEEQSQCYIKTDCKNEFTYFKIAEGGVKDTSATYKITVDNEGIFNITKNMFDDDALIVEDNQIHSLSLLDSNKNEYVKVEFDMPLCGIWSPAKKNAPFICLEPWCGRCDSKDFDGELQDREYENKLKLSEEFESGYSITIY